MPGPGVADPAPDFTLPGTGARDYTLSDYRGQPVVLVFYPGDNTPVCTVQLRSYSDGIANFDEIGAQVLAISPQDVASHEGFAQSNSLRMPLLADTDKAVGELYGILGPLGFYRRSVFVIDGDGIIRFVRRSLSSLTFVDAGVLVDAVKEMGLRESG
ncbi:MAG TPA: peroxiredoxin [Acidimicrobiales bacterium]|nr:peroxiredoxin [Acidimicrobiales bacterium]